MTQTLKTDYIPSTFAERGVAVPFTTPLLNQARMRQDRNRQFEFLLPGFTGGKGTYVMPWKTLPSVMTVTLHDRLLYEEMEGVDDHSPEAIRAASLRVARTGVCGGDAAKAAEKSLESDAQYLVLTNFVFVTELLKLVGIGAADLIRPGMSTEESKRLARESLNKVAEIVRVHPDELYGRVETLSAAIFPIGLAQCPQAGRLRALLVRLEGFREGVAAWVERENSDAADLGRFAGIVAQHTIDLCRVRLDLLDRQCADLKKVITDHDRFRGVVTDHVSRLSWLLDGWDFLVGMWEAVADKPPEAQATAMSELTRFVPMIPKEEFASPDNFDMDGIAKLQRRWVRMNEDWRTGSLDMDAVMRIEQLKAAVA
ncbi:MAG TPA: hypothetical protein VED40_08285 [Azospirillaceae bacterium]|nr:hypothetical protein [Azospirillaceae bacterium]